MTGMADFYDWQKSSHSGAENDCVEVASNPADLVPVRDSKSVPGPVVFPPAQLVLVRRLGEGRGFA